MFLINFLDVLDNEQLDATTSSMRAVLQKLAEAKYSSQLENLGESDLRGLMDICNQTQIPAIKVNIIKSLGTIGYLIANSKLFQSCHNHIKVSNMEIYYAISFPFCIIIYKYKKSIYLYIIFKCLKINSSLMQFFH